MVAERIPYLDQLQDMSMPPMEYWSNSELVQFMLKRRSSTPISQKNSGRIMYPSNARRFSMQYDGSHFDNVAAQSRHLCVQKPPLRTVLSAPLSQVNNTSNCHLPQPPLIQRQDTFTQSIESIESSAVLEPARYKTELCTSFVETGNCRYGAKCQFAHGRDEQRPVNRHPKYKTENCKTFHTTGFCSYGKRCTFIHNDRERRGPPPSSMSTQNNSRSPMSMVLPISAPLTITSTGDSPTSSIASGSPTQSPGFLNDESFITRHSPTPSFGSDGASLASTYTPPASPKHEMATDHLSSPLDMGLNVTLFNQLSL